MAIKLSLPPLPIITRKGTWLNAVNYYCDNFKTLSNVIIKLDSKESICVRIAEECFNDVNIDYNTNDRKRITLKYCFWSYCHALKSSEGSTVDPWLTNAPHNEHFA